MTFAFSLALSKEGGCPFEQVVGRSVVAWLQCLSAGKGAKLLLVHNLVRA
jgi:hypothetical protein